MNSLLLLKDYNNYFNRIVKPYNEITIRDFILARENIEYEIISNINFIPNDFINTEQIINWNENWCPDYVIVADDEGNIMHSWFIVEAQRTRLGQFHLSLKRDTVSDFYEFLKVSPVFIEKANLPSNNPLIFNSEGMAFNQIKTNEYLLKDQSEIPWIVGYVATNSFDEDKTIEVQDINFETFANLENWEYKDYAYYDGHEGSEIYTNPTTWEFIMSYKTSDQASSTWYPSVYTRMNGDISKIAYDSTNNTYDGISTEKTINFNTFGVPSLTISEKFNNTIPHIGLPKIYNQAFYEYRNFIVSDLSNLLQKQIEDYNKIIALDGLYIRSTEDNLVYKVKVETENKKVETKIQSSSNTVFNNINARVAELINEKYYSLVSANVNTSSVSFEGALQNLMSCKIRLIPANEGNLHATFKSGNKNLMDAPYKMFGIPYGKISINNEGYSNLENSLTFIAKMANELGTKIYDIQLLPYCPRPEMIGTVQHGKAKAIITDGWTVDEDYTLITTIPNGDDTPENRGIVLWCNSSSNSFSIPFNYFVKDVKLENECDLWRLCSPNYQGLFDFSAAKNNGIMAFNVDYTYKPYNPYIHVAPEWGGLYGQNWNDARGLICGGDYSIATTSEAFAQYEINNKNYQNIFDRGIQNLDTMRKYQSIEEHIAAIGGSFESSAAGFSAGSMGGPWGAAIGAAIGGTVGLASGAADIALSSAKFKENKSYQTDLYNYNLQNIQAQPNSLTKTSALNKNNKLFPFVEYYTCTDEEKRAFKNKLKYNGMTVMAIDTIENILLPNEDDQFIQGQLIRISGICDDSHIGYDIYNELKKGVYINVNTEFNQ